jgi:trans-aconitate methyltransferase
VLVLQKVEKESIVKFKRKITQQLMKETAMPDFDYQWKNLPSKDIEYNDSRVREFKKLLKLDVKQVVRGRYCFDIGCGNGRYTYAMQQLGAARVDSIDISPEAVEKCKQVNPDARVFDLMELPPHLHPPYEFVWCWGVLNHIEGPREGFRRVASQVADGGCLHVMVYNKKDQIQYETDRQSWKTLSLEQKLALCQERSKSKGGTVHGWWDALNPTFNWGFEPSDVKQWFLDEGFTQVQIVTESSININGFKGKPMGDTKKPGRFRFWSKQ